MSTDPKTAELTDAEIRSLEEPLANWAVSQVWLDDTDPLCIEVARIVAAREADIWDEAKVVMARPVPHGWVSPEEAKAREAAARREALLEAAEVLPNMTEGDRREGTRRWPLPQRDAYSLAIEEAQGALRALAEPERDEESGR